MNYSQPGSQIRQSDQIMRKLDEIKFAIEGRNESSPGNLHHYLPQQRLQSNPNAKSRLENRGNPQSYRQSLQKKLERLFKQQRKVFNEFQERSHDHQISNNNNESFIELKFESKDAFTIERMENKIKELERKYLHSEPASELKNRSRKAQKQEGRIKKQKSIRYERQESKQTPAKKTKSIYDKPEFEKQGTRNRNRNNLREQLITNKSDKRLIIQIGQLKKQVRQIKQSNLSLNEKIEHKENQRKDKKQRSRYLLKCILAKLIDIQEEVRRRDITENQRTSKKQIKLKTPAEQRQSLKYENSLLIRQVQELGQQLRKEVSEKQRAQERSDWIESQLRKLNKR